MRMLNVLGIPIVTMIVVAVAFLARHAESAEPRQVWLTGLNQPVKQITIFSRRDGLIEEAAQFHGIQGVISAIRQADGPLPDDKTDAARTADAFLLEAAARFPQEEMPPGKTIGAAMPLTPSGPLRAGFVTRVWVDNTRCDFAIAGYDPERTGEIAVMARAVVCGAHSSLAPADIRVAGLLSRAD